MVLTPLYLYRRIFSIPLHDPRLEQLTDWELGVEIEGAVLYRKIIDKKPLQEEEEFESDEETRQMVDKLASDDSEDNWGDFIGPELSPEELAKVQAELVAQGALKE